MRTFQTVERGGFFGGIANSRLAKVIGGVVVVVGIVILAISAFGFLSTLGIFILLGLIIVFGSLGRLAGAIVIASLLSLLRDDLLQLLAIWGDYPRVTETMSLLFNMGFLRSAFAIFLIAFSLYYLTSQIRIFNLSSSSESKIEKPDEDS